MMSQNYDMNTNNMQMADNISEPKSRQVSFIGQNAIGQNGPYGNNTAADATQKNIDPGRQQPRVSGASNVSSNSMGMAAKKNSLIRRIKEYQVSRQGEKFYRFVHHDLNLAITYVGSLCVLFHLFCTLVRECEKRDWDQRPGLQKFTDAIVRLGAAVFLGFVTIRKAPQFWHAPLYFWMSLNLYAYDWDSETTTGFSILTGTLALMISIIIALREIRFFYESPRLYRSFSQNASLVDERGRILFYSRLKIALVDAGATPDIEHRQINILLDGLEIFEKSVDDPSVIVEEVYLTFDQFALLFESYCRLCDAGVQFGSKNSAVGNGNSMGTSGKMSNSKPDMLAKLPSLSAMPISVTGGPGNMSNNNSRNGDVTNTSQTHNMSHSNSGNSNVSSNNNNKSRNGRNDEISEQYQCNNQPGPETEMMNQNHNNNINNNMIGNSGGNHINVHDTSADDLHLDEIAIHDEEDDERIQQY